MELFAGTVIADRFHLQRQLGAGGMGTVWLARHMGLDVPCAVKFILAQAAQSPELRARFQREAKAAAHIKSPNVVQILDYGVWQDTPYIAMEYLEGEDLGARLHRRGRLDARETATIVGQVAHALGKAHAMGVVHRDIKPTNIFLVRDDDGEIAKVVDFGIAKSLSQEIGEGHTRTGALVGTPHYMSPEQAQGNRAVDHRSDLWALAVVAFQCLTGKLPFESDGLGELVLKIMVHPLPIPSQIAAVPSGFDAWWARAAARDPAQRFQSAKELSESLYLALGLSSRSIGDLHDSLPPSAPAGSPGQTMVLPVTPSYPQPSQGSPLPSPSYPPPSPSYPPPSSSLPPPSSSSLPPTPFGVVLPAPATPQAPKRRGILIAVIGGACVLVLAGVTALALNARMTPSATTAPSASTTAPGTPIAAGVASAAEHGPASQPSAIPPELGERPSAVPAASTPAAATAGPRPPYKPPPRGGGRPRGKPTSDVPDFGF